MSRPQAVYRQQLLRELAALAPANILEVGCGGGGFLRSARELGLNVSGIDPDDAALRALIDEGFAVSRGRAERLEFADGAFDAIVFCFAAHHIEDWSAALREAARVAREAIFVLDPWYDLSIPSQAVAEQFDRWCKAIDRATGMVHNDCLDSTQLLMPLASQLSSFDVTLARLLVLHDYSLARVDEIATEQLAKIANNSRAAAEYAAITARARRDGFSDDGAILLSLCRKSARA